MKALVIPTNRPEHVKAFFEAWGDRGGWDHVYVIEDGPTKSFDAAGIANPTPSIDKRRPVTHFAWDTIAGAAGDEAWIFSKRDSAIRCFGFWAAVRDGATSILTLDDDCLPCGNDWVTGVRDFMPLFDQHLAVMGSFTKWCGSVKGMRTRGLPYKNFGKLDTVTANVGLWTGNPDVDAPTSLVSGVESQFVPPAGNRLIPAGQYFPVCGMNLCFKAEAAPLFYFPLMGEGQPYRRFDDIWAGVIARKIFDHLGWQFSVGEPFVRHARASDPFVNLVKEAPGIAANETFWESIDTISLAGVHTPLECVARVGIELLGSDDTYNHKLGQALMGWKRLWDKIYTRPSARSFTSVQSTSPGAGTTS